MLRTCPRCSRSLPDSVEAIRFCPYCGARVADGLNDPTPARAGTTADIEPTPPAPDPQPDAIGGYRVVRLLGVGGMGHVYEAEWPATGQRVAVKLLSSQLVANPVSLERFRQEGRLASQLQHPRCVFVLAADTDHGRPYIVMELMPGDTLKDLVDRRGPLPAPEAIRLTLDVIDGLREAHRLGVIHRDVKPSNCFLMPDGRVKIGDFGLSKSLTASNQLTQSGAFLGTVLYASPEQIRGEAVDYASDVYSVSATLYHLLTGQAPFQTENVTAALARIISEDPPPVRSVRPSVSPALARVVERGLERDRGRRYQTLDELRAALAALVPEQLTFGGLGVRVAAYVLDELLVGLLLAVPIAGLLRPLTPVGELPIWLQAVLSPLYFIVLEGLWGASLAKRLFGLRVCRIGTAEPPGLLRAALRTVIFTLLINVTFAQPRIVFNQLAEEPAGPHLLASAVPFVLGLLLLAVPMRRSNDFRGLHEMLSGTCVLRLPRPPRPLRLTGSATSPLLELPPRQEPIPKAIGPYPVRAGSAAPNGRYLLVGEDAVLGRQVLIDVGPPQAARPRVARHAVSRPTRLRFLQSGSVAIQGAEYAWEVFVAPAGRPLADVASRRRLSWRETRPILEQLAEELAAAAQDGTTPPTLSVDQVWVQPDGRVQLLDCPLPGPKLPTTVPDALALLRSTAALALEGRLDPASAGLPVRAPVPRHAARLLQRLAGSGKPPLRGVTGFRDDLLTTREAPTHVTQAMRLTQIGLQALFLTPGLLVMLAVSGFFALFGAVEHAEHARDGKALLEMLSTAEGRARLSADPALAGYLADPTFADRVRAQVERDTAARDALLPSLGRVERILWRQTEAKAAESAALGPDRSGAEWLAAARRAAGPGQEEGLRPGRVGDAVALIVMWPVLWAAAAFALRGGASLSLTRMTFVRRDGRDATRMQFAVRVLAVWGPVALLLAASVTAEAYVPGWHVLRWLLWWSAVGLLAGHLFLAVSFPERAPHDRWLGLQLVPR